MDVGERGAATGLAVREDNVTKVLKSRQVLYPRNMLN